MANLRIQLTEAWQGAKPGEILLLEAGLARDLSARGKARVLGEPRGSSRPGTQTPLGPLETKES